VSKTVAFVDRAQMDSQIPGAMVPYPSSICHTCGHLRIIRSGKGSVFLLCEAKPPVPDWPKYPRQPVFSCHLRCPKSSTDLGSQPAKG
jgi:hypothetical protein